MFSYGKFNNKYLSTIVVLQKVNLFWCTVLQDVINTLLPKVLTKIIEGLQDLDDDVRAVAAASLVPVVESLVYLQTQKVSLIYFFGIFFL